MGLSPSLPGFGIQVMVVSFHSSFFSFSSSSPPSLVWCHLAHGAMMVDHFSLFPWRAGGSLCPPRLGSPLRSLV